MEGDVRLISYTEKLLAVSFVTEIELLGMPGITVAQQKRCSALLDDCLMISYTPEIKDIAINLRQKRKLSLGDSLIAATGIEYKLPILTFDKGFTKIKGIDLVLLE